jgi:hypothetical protein
MTMYRLLPPLMSGRITDIGTDPLDYSTWYTAVGSGDVWNTADRHASGAAAGVPGRN